MLDAALGGADSARLFSIRLLGPWAKRILVDRDTRIATAGLVLVLLALASTAAVPLWVIGIGPIVWGVPHVLADLRYLVVRLGYHRRARVIVPVVCGLALALFGLGVRGALMGTLACVLVSGAWTVRRLAVAAFVASLLAVAFRTGNNADFAFVQIHNAVALGFFAAWRRRDRSKKNMYLAPIVLTAIGALLIMMGAFDFALVPRAMPHGLSLNDLAWQLSPARDPLVARRFVLLYAFGQTVHYVAWLRLLPEEDRTSPRPRSFRQSYRALARDLTPWLLGLAAIGAVVLAAYAFDDLGMARFRYLQAAFFHGYIEIAAAALLLAEGRRDLSFTRKSVTGRTPANTRC